MHRRDSNTSSRSDNTLMLNYIIVRFFVNSVFDSYSIRPQYFDSVISNVDFVVLLRKYYT